MRLLRCPFCGTRPVYDEENQTVHCPAVDCAIGDFYINPEEWNRRRLPQQIILKYLFDVQAVYKGADFYKTQEYVCNACGAAAKDCLKVRHRKNCEIKKLLETIM